MGTVSLGLSISEEGETTTPVLSVVVAGAEGLDGEYTFRGQYNGKDYFNLFGTPDSVSENAIVYKGGAWAINDGGGSNYAKTTSDAEFPWQADWSGYDGLSVTEE